MKKILVVFLLTCSAMADSVDMVHSGKPVAEVIVLDERTSPAGNDKNDAVVNAATELIDHIEKISGAKLTFHHIKPEALEETTRQIILRKNLPIVLGQAARGRTAASDRQALHDPSGFILKVDKTGVAIEGATPEATTFGVYELLEQIGVRWFFPGALGTVIPSLETVSISVQDLASRPTFKARHFPVPNAKEWARYQRMGGPYFPPAHGIPMGKEVTFKTHPQYYALVNGKRTSRQVCLTNADVLRLATEEARKVFRKNPERLWVGMGPNDGSGFCQCEPCKALDAGDWDSFSNEASVTDRYIWFFNQVLANIRDEFPDKMIAFYVYHSYMRPPVKIRPDPRIAAAIAPIGLCRIHGVNNPVCPERDYLKKLIPEWTKILPNVYERGYWFNLADPGMLFSQIHRLREEIPFYAKHGIQGFRVECMGHWAVEGPSLYIAGKLLWDSTADPDALLKDFCTRLFGPAAAPMQAYFGMVEERLAHSDHHAGSAFNITHIFPESERSRMKKELARAQTLATQSPWRERVALFMDGFRHNDLLAEMIEAQNRQEWLIAAAHLGELDKVQARLIAYDPPMLNERFSVSYLKRFFRLPVEQAAARHSEGNELVAQLSSKWKFLIDPQGVGSDLHYERPELTGGNWQVMDATQTWSDVGLRYYKGLSWYRQSIEVDAKWKGKRLFLWFGGVDETARVWVNGTLVGTSPSSAFTPFEVDITEAVRAGEPNTVVLCVANERVDELGTGGVMAPAFIYAPEKGAAAVLENIRPLRDTFP